jgi:hypothetical protein
MIFPNSDIKQDNPLVINTQIGIYKNDLDQYTTIWT